MACYSIWVRRRSGFARPCFVEEGVRASKSESERCRLGRKSVRSSIEAEEKEKKEANSPVLLPLYFVSVSFVNIERQRKPGKQTRGEGERRWRANKD